MTPIGLYPLLFEPQLRHYVWGGRNLERLFGRPLPPGPTAESWEISGHPAAPTSVSNGYLAGRTLPELVEELGDALLGSRVLASLTTPRFPLLVKLLDAQQDLSVQVHPDDAYAMVHENGELGKVEAWYVLAADRSTRLVYGLRPGTDRETLSKALMDGSVTSLLNYLPVTPGDCVFVPAGTVHALMAGAIVAEIQQTSDATYRLYDWGRLGPDGKPRTLHIDKALEVIAWDGQGPGVVPARLLDASDGMQRWSLVSCPQFNLEKITLERGACFQGRCSGETFEIWGCIRGSVSVQSADALALSAVRFALLPAALGDYRITAGDTAELLRAFVGPQA